MSFSLTTLAVRPPLFTVPPTVLGTVWAAVASEVRLSVHYTVRGPNAVLFCLMTTEVVVCIQQDKAPYWPRMKANLFTHYK